MDLTLSWLGIEEVDRRLQSISLVARERALRVAMTRAMQPVLLAAQAGAPRRSGALRVSLGILATSAMRQGRFAARFGRDQNLAASVAVVPRARDSRAIALYNISYGRRQRVRGIFYAHMLEFGTLKGVKPTRFLSRAIAANSQRVLSTFTFELERAIERAARVPKARVPK